LWTHYTQHSLLGVQVEPVQAWNGVFGGPAKVLRGLRDGDDDDDDDDGDDDDYIIITIIIYVYMYICIYTERERSF